MAYGVVASQILPDDNVSDADDFWNVSHDVYPALGKLTTDVMLVQGLLIGSFSTRA